MIDQPLPDRVEEAHQTEMALLRSALWANYGRAVMFLLLGIAALGSVRHLANVACRLAGAP